MLEDAAVDRPDDAAGAVADAAATVDALVGYSLHGPPRGRLAALVELVAERARRVVSLDVPTGVDATTGESPGVAVDPDVTVTLALPKTGLTAVGGDRWLADIGIPAPVYERTGLDYEPLFAGDRWRVPLTTDVPE